LIIFYIGIVLKKRFITRERRMENRLKRGAFILMALVFHGVQGQCGVLDTIVEFTKRFGPSFTYVCIGACAVDALQPQVSYDKHGPVRYIPADKQAELAEKIRTSFHALNHKEALQKCSQEDVLFKVQNSGNLVAKWQGKLVQGNYKKDRLRVVKNQ